MFWRFMKAITNVCYLTPNNFLHKAGDGTNTRKRNISYIHPALQANCGATQCTYLLVRILMEMVKIKQATKQGYALCEVGGVADFSYPDSKTRRGRVQGNGQICPTITSEVMMICKIEKLNIE